MDHFLHEDHAFRSLHSWFFLHHLLYLQSCFLSHALLIDFYRALRIGERFRIPFPQFPAFRILIRDAVIREQIFLWLTDMLHPTYEQVIDHILRFLSIIEINFIHFPQIIIDNIELPFRLEHKKLIRKIICEMAIESLETDIPFPITFFFLVFCGAFLCFLLIFLILLYFNLWVRRSFYFRMERS